MQQTRVSWVASLVVLVIALILAGSAGGTQRFTDPPGDASGGPDVRTVSISDSGGIVRFTFVVPHLMPTVESGQSVGAVLAVIDANKDGKPDYDLFFQKSSDGFEWVAQKHLGKALPLTPEMQHIASGDTYTFSLGSSDLGGTLGFAFNVTTATIDEGGTVTRSDNAPDGGVWTYDLTSIKPVIGMPTANPATPVAGKAFTVTMPLTRSDTGDKLSVAKGAKLTIDPTIGGLPVKHVDALKSGSAILHLTVPPNTTGKQLKVVTQVGLGTRTAHTVTTWKIA